MSENVVKNRIVIEGEAKYKQTLREIAQGLREAKSEVKAADAEMRAQGETAEAAQGKLQALGKVYDAQQEQLAAMQEHLEKVTTAYGENSREASELRTRINNLRAEASGTAGQMRTLSTQLDAAADATASLDGAVSAMPGKLAALGQSAGGAADEAGGLLDTISGLLGGEQLISFAVGAASAAGIAGAVREAAVIGWTEALEDQRLKNKIGVKTGTAGTEDNALLMAAAETLQLLQPYISDDEAAAMVASVWTRASGTEIVTNATDFAEAMERIYIVATGTDLSFDTVAEGAKNLAASFEGTDFMEAVSLIYGIGTSNAGSDGVKVVADYAENFAALGMNAGEAGAAVVSASDNGITKLPQFGQAVKNLDTWMSELNGETEGIEKLGIAGEDLGNKYEKGGETARAAVELMIKKLKEVEDPDTQNELGEAIFGAEAWKKYGMKIADAILDGYAEPLGPGLKEALDNAVAASTADFQSQMAILKKQIADGIAAEVFSPIADTWTGVLQDVNGAMMESRENGGNLLTNLAAGAGALAESYWNKVVVKAAENTAAMLTEGAAEAEETVQGIFGDVDQQIADAWARGEEDLARQLLEQKSAMQEAAGDVTAQAEEEAAQAAEAPVNTAKERIQELNEEIQTALDAGDTALADKLRAERDALIPEMMAMQQDIQGAADGVTVTVTDAETGAEEALSALPESGQDAADGLTRVFQLEMQELYRAGWDMGSSLQNGFNAALDIHSPSRVMAESARYTLEGLLGEFDAGEAEIAARGQAMAEALQNGYAQETAGNQASFAQGAPAGQGAGISPGDIAEAVRGALSGLGVYIDGRPAGYLLEEYVSEATSERASGTVTGRSAAAKGW